MISTHDKVIGLITEAEMAIARKSAVVVTANFQLKYLKDALEILEKMDCEEVKIELADNQPIFFKPEQYKPNTDVKKNIFTSVIGVAVCNMEDI